MHFGGLDLSSTTDITAWCVGKKLEDGYKADFRFYIPEDRARIIEDRSEIDREVKAGQMGFSAYAVTRAEDDPLALAIHGLLDHAVETDRRIEALLKTMERCGVALEDDVATADNFDPKHISKIVD